MVRSKWPINYLVGQNDPPPSSPPPTVGSFSAYKNKGKKAKVGQDDQQCYKVGQNGTLPPLQQWALSVPTEKRAKK